MAELGWIHVVETPEKLETKEFSFSSGDEERVSDSSEEDEDKLATIGQH